VSSPGGQELPPGPVPSGIYRPGFEALVRRYGYTPDAIEQAMIVTDAVLAYLDRLLTVSWPPYRDHIAEQAAGRLAEGNPNG
jgi:hypothetical protein